MQRLNVSLDDSLYNKLRALSFKQKKSMSEIIRESLRETVDYQFKNDANIVLDPRDRAKLLETIEENEYIDWIELKKKHNLS